MTPPRFPFWHMAAIAIWFVGVCFMAMVIWAALMLGKPVSAKDIALLLWHACGLVWSVMNFDRYTFKREHLQAEQALTRAYRALHACGELIRYRVDRGIPVRGTPLHTVALVRKRRALEALQVAQAFRAKRDGIT